VRVAWAGCQTLAVGSKGSHDPRQLGHEPLALSVAVRVQRGTVHFLHFGVSTMTNPVPAAVAKRGAAVQAPPAGIVHRGGAPTAPFARVAHDPIKVITYGAGATW